MKKISAEVDDFLIQKKAAKEFENLQEMDIAPLLAGLRQKILELKEIEKTAFQTLSDIIE